MNKQSVFALLRASIRRRIAITMILSLIAIQLQAFVQIRVLSKPELRVTGTRWLALQMASAARDAFDVPPEHRTEVLRRHDTDIPFTFSWRNTAPRVASATQNRALTGRLAATLRQLLGPKAGAIVISAEPTVGGFPIDSLPTVVFPPDLAQRVDVSPVTASQPDVLIPASLTLAVQAPDGTWVVATPVPLDGGPWPWGRPIAPLLAGGLIIALVSVATARSTVAPLDGLVQAAKQLGTSRQYVPVATKGLGEYAPVAEAFEQMQQRLLRFVEDRTQMLAAISHDLRSSLTRLRIALEVDSPDAGGQAAMAEIEDMQAMLESTLVFASGEAQAAPGQLTDIAALLISLVDDAADAGKDCCYEGPNHVEVFGHPLALKRAFRNLIDNAVKYGDCARVALIAAATGITVTIEDNGAGIPADRVEEAFAPFQRLDKARSNEIHGAGLGLTIARDVIQSHGGTITLGSGAGGGFRVTVVMENMAASPHTHDVCNKSK